MILINHSISRALQAVLAPALLSGCIPYPVMKTLQPAATVRVTDVQGGPVPATAVTLIASSYPYGFEKNRATKYTAVNGVVAFKGLSEFRVEAIALHGSEEFFWNWCVQKEGFETVETSHRNASTFEKEFAVVLKMGLSTPCRVGLGLKKYGEHPNQGPSARVNL